MALSADVLYDAYPARPQQGSFEIVDAAVMYANAVAAICHRGHGTAANIGRIKPYSGAAGEFPIGLVTQPKTGDTSASPIVRAALDTDGRVINTAVTGLAGTEDDTLRVVYASDDGTFTLTRPTRGLPIGIVDDQISSTRAWVRIFGVETLIAIAMGGAMKRTWCVGTICPEAGTGAVDALKGIVAPHHGRLINYYLICASAPADADVAGPVTVEIDGTDVDYATNNPLINFADTLGLKKSGAGAITETEFQEGSLIDIETDLTAAGTVIDGLYNVYLEYILEPGL